MSAIANYDYGKVVGRRAEGLHVYENVRSYMTKEEFYIGPISQVEEIETLLKHLRMLMHALDSTFNDMCDSGFALPSTADEKKACLLEFKYTVKARENLLTLILGQRNALHEKAMRSRADTESDHISYDVFVFSLLSACSVNMHALEVVHGKGKLHYTSRGFPCTKFLNVPQDDVRIIDYSMTQAVSALRTFEARFGTCAYHENLRAYIEAIFLRIAFICRTTQPERIANVSKYRTQVASADPQAPPSFMCNQTFFEDMCWSYADILTKITQADYFYSKSVDWEDRKKTAVITEEEVTLWVYKMAATTHNENIGLDFNKDYYRHLLKPGWRERYLRDTNKIPTADRTISTYSGKQYAKAIRKMMERSPEELLNTNNLDPVAKDLLRLRVIVMHFVGNHRFNWEHTSVLYTWQLSTVMSEALSSEWPLVVEVMNHFHILYGTRFYSCTSLSEAVMLWLDIIFKEHRGKYREIDLTNTLQAIKKEAKRQPLMFIESSAKTVVDSKGRTMVSL